MSDDDAEGPDPAGLLELFDIAFVPDPAKMPAELAEHWRDLNATIGYITTEWAGLETQLAALLAGLLRCKLVQAQVIPGTLVANKVKRDLITNVARLTLASDRTLHRVEALMRRTAKVARKRNSLAHGMGLFHTKHPERLTVMNVSADLDPALTHYEAWSLHALQEVTQTLRALSGDVLLAAHDLRRARRRPLPETRNPAPAQGTVSANSRRPPRADKPQGPPKPSRK